MGNNDLRSPLTGPQREAIAAALESKGAAKPCPRCDHGGLEIKDALVSVQAIDPTGHLDNKGIASVAVVCLNCGHVMLHEASSLDVEAAQ